MNMVREYRRRSLSSDAINSNVCSPAMSVETISSDESQPMNIESHPIRNYRRSNSATGSYTVDYGPIRIRHRLTASQTLATGRRSKDAPSHGDEAIKRETRRLKNRLAARELKKTRDQIELDLVETVERLEQERNDLLEQQKQLEERKAQLNRAVYNAKQASLVPFITDIDLPVLFGPQERQDLLIDLQPLLRSIDEHC